MNDMSFFATLNPTTAPTPDDSLPLLREMMFAQAHTLNAMFTQLVGDAASSRPFLTSTATYTRLALRAQANCRASLQALEKTDRPGRAGAEK